MRGSDGRCLVARLEGPDEGEVVLLHTGTPDDGPLYPASRRRGWTGWREWGRRTSPSLPRPRPERTPCRPISSARAETYGSVSGEDIRRALGDLISAADRPTLTGELAEFTAAAMRRSVRNGIWGWLDDDRFVPFSHGVWLAANVPGARSCLKTGEGHLSLVVNAYGQILDQLTA